MDLSRDIEAAKRRLNKVAPKVNPPKLTMNVYSEEEWNNKKPTDKSQWELNLVVEAKRPYIENQRNSLEAIRLSSSST